jgi:hypothetical protein
MVTGKSTEAYEVQPSEIYFNSGSNWETYDIIGDNSKKKMSVNGQ